MADSKNNPYNPQSQLFQRLTRLFSGPIVNWRTQINRKIKRTDIDKYASKFRSASGQQFRRANYSPFDVMHSKIMAQQNRAERYTDYEQMEYMPELASGLDIYADEMTTHSSLQPMLDIKCQNDEIKSVLHSLYTNVINLEHNLFGWCRSMVKFGDFMLYLDIDERLGIKGVISLPLKEIERLEGEDPTNPNYVQFQWNTAGLTFENWQVAHFRILGNDKYAPYGTAVLEPGRRIWRQLVLMEDAMMAYRIVRSAERRVFYIDVGNIAPQDVETFIQKTITAMKRNQVVDAKSGRVDLRYNPLSVEEDYFIPIRGGENSRIENLPGGAFTGDIDDVKYLRDKLFAAIKIPPAYLSADREVSEDQTTLAQKDIRFSRTIQRLQRSVISELEKIGIIHLYTLGFRGDDLISFRLTLNNPSKIAEMQELEIWQSKFDIAGGAMENYFSRRWISQHLLGLSDEEFLRNQREIYFDRKYEASLNAAAEKVAEEAAASMEGGGMGELGGDLGGGDLGVDLGGEEGGDLGGEEGGDLGGEEGDEALLAAPPAKRDDRNRAATKKSLTKKSKGKQYVSKTHRGGDARNGRPQSYTATAFPKPDKGIPIQAFNSLAKGIYENEESNYSRDEKLLFEARTEIRNLISDLERLEITVDEKKEDETKT